VNTGNTDKYICPPCHATLYIASVDIFYGLNLMSDIWNLNLEVLVILSCNIKKRPEKIKFESIVK